MSEYKWKPFTLLVSADEVKGNEMKIEAGKYYKTRDGRKVGPIERGEQHNSGGPWFFKFGNNHFEKNGHSCRNGFGFDNNPEDDLISEWQDEAPSPIRTVTRREIVSGQYGLIEVVDVDENGASLLMPRNGRFPAETLREMAHLLNQIAEVLEENGE